MESDHFVSSPLAHRPVGAVPLRRGEEQDPSIDVFVGARLRSRREACAFDHDDLAILINATADQIEAYERGEVRIDPMHLIQFSRLLDVRLTFFFPAP